MNCANVVRWLETKWVSFGFHGRVNAVNMLFIGSSNELGEFCAGTRAPAVT